MDSLYAPNVVDLDTNKCVLLPSHDEESNHCCDDQDTIESNSNVGHGHSRRKKRRRKKRRGENQFTHNDGDRQSHNPPAWCHVLISTSIGWELSSFSLSYSTSPISISSSFIISFNDVISPSLSSDCSSSSYSSLSDSISCNG